MATLTTEVLPRHRMSRARLFVGIDQAEMARLLGRSKNTISAWERGVNEPPVTAVAAWAQITGRSIEWIMWGEDGMPNASANMTEALDWCTPRDLNPEPTD